MQINWCRPSNGIGAKNYGICCFLFFFDLCCRQSKQNVSAVVIKTLDKILYKLSYYSNSINIIKKKKKSFPAFPIRVLCCVFALSSIDLFCFLLLFITNAIVHCCCAFIVIMLRICAPIKPRAASIEIESLSKKAQILILSNVSDILTKTKTNTL